MRLSVCGAHRFPVVVGTPRSLRAAQIERVDSPARKRRAHSRTISASSRRIVTLSASQP